MAEVAKQLSQHSLDILVNAGLILMAIGMAGLGFAARQVAPVVTVSNLSGKPLQSTEGATRDCEICQPEPTKEFERVPSAESQEVDAAAMALTEVTLLIAALKQLLKLC